MILAWLDTHGWHRPDPINETEHVSWTIGRGCGIGAVEML